MQYMATKGQKLHDSQRDLGNSFFAKYRLLLLVFRIKRIVYHGEVHNEITLS